MKYFALLFLPILASAQAVRVDPTPVFQTAAQSGIGLNPMLAVANSTIYVCMAPANGNPCTNFAVTYTDASAATACPSSQPVVLRGTNTCTSTSDAQGNFGFWLAAGNYFYQIQTPQGIIYGPWPISAGGSGGVQPSSCSVSGAYVTAVNANTVTCSTPAGTNGSLSGPVSTGTISGVTPGILRDEQQALDLGNKSTNGIATAIANCFTNGGICNADVSYLYGTSESVPGYGMNWFVFTPSAPSALPSQYSNGASVFDHRYGWYPVAYNHPGNNSGNNHFWSHWNAVYNDPSWVVAADNIGALNIESAFLHGGRNTNADGSTDKTNVNALTVAQQKWGLNQAVTLQVNNVGYANGDTIDETAYAVGFGGMNAATDEGTHTGDAIAIEGNVEDAGTITSSNASNGATSITVNETQGALTAGQGRYIVIGTPTSGTIATNGLYSPGNIYTTITANGTPFSVSSVIGVIGTAISVTPGSTVTATITPSSYLTGSISGYTVGAVVCLSDGGNYELAKVLTNNGTSFTATLDRSFTSAANAAVGGCGYGLDITVDDASSANPNTSVHIRTIIGTLHKYIPVAYTTSSSVAYLWYSVAGSFDSLQTEETNSSNGFTLAPIAEIENVITAGAVSSTWALSPNIATTSASTPFFVPIDFRNRISNGQNIVEAYTFSSSNAPTSGGIQYNAPLGGTASMWMLTNNGSPTLYNTNGGKMYGPFAIPITGEHSIGLLERTSPGNAGHEIDCPNLTYNTCNKTYGFLKAMNGTAGFDYLYYTQTAASPHWTLSAGSGTVNYMFYPDGVTIPAVADGTVTNAPASLQKLYYSTTQSAVCTVDSSGTKHCGAGGTVNTPASTGTYTITGTSTGTAVPISTPTQIVLTPTCAANNTATVSGPCLSSAGAVVNGTYTRNVTSSSDTLRQADWGGFVLYGSGSSAVAVPQPGVGGNLEAEWHVTLRNMSGSTVNFMPSGGSTINGSTSAFPISTGSGCELRSNGTNLTCY